MALRYIHVCCDVFEFLEGAGYRVLFDSTGLRHSLERFKIGVKVLEYVFDWNFHYDGMFFFIVLKSWCSKCGKCGQGWELIVVVVVDKVWINFVKRYLYYILAIILMNDYSILAHMIENHTLRFTFSLHEAEHKAHGMTTSLPTQNREHFTDTRYLHLQS